MIRFDCDYVEGAHPAIIDDALFEAVQAMFRASSHASHVRADKSLANPLAGLVYCSVCGKLMFQRGGKKKRLLTCFHRRSSRRTGCWSTA